MPAYAPELDTDDNDPANFALPGLLLCTVAETPDGKKTLALAPSIRNKWNEDTQCCGEWQAEIAAFDARQLAYQTVHLCNDLPATYPYSINNHES